jgi:glycine dehydrogenase
MRYIRRLFNKDIALDTAMIPLGSCTMKLNSASEMMPVSWPEFSSIHPLAPTNQINGYMELIDELEAMLVAITGYSGISLQPNAGSQGEYAGLLAINAYHKSNGGNDRNICLIPRSAHGTNPASAQMVGLKVVPIECNLEGNISIKDLKEKTELHKNKLSAIMITYPSTHGVFESSVTEVCKIVHEAGGLVYIDGANLNAMVGLCYPGKFGGDVSHLNLHKTFCIPHGGGGPGVGPIGVVDKLKKFVPSFHDNSTSDVGPVSGSDWGSASILPISWMYIKMMGARGLRKATEIAILNANYIAFRLKDDYQILYKGESGLVAHECILDVRPFKDSAEIEVEDIAKRLIDYGFHAPTMSWPVAGTLMIEPTESESRLEVDRFCDAMISIRSEIRDIEAGILDKNDNMLKNAPHTAEEVSGNEWMHSYSRVRAAYPVDSLKNNKFWPPVGRVDNTYGDRNLICSCPSMDDF